MCVDRDRHPAGRRRGRRAARWRRWWWCSWWEAFDGPRGRRGGAAGHACRSAVDAGQPAADGGSSSADADGAAEHAHRAAQHAEHAAAAHGDARWRHGRHGWHGPAPGSKLPAAERGIAATAESSATLASQRNRAAAAVGSGTQHRVTSRAWLDPPIGSFTHLRSGRASRRSRSPRSGRWNRSDAAFAGSNARSSRFWPWIRRRARLGQQAGRRIRDEAGAAARSDRRGWWWSTRCQHAAWPDRQPSWNPHDEAVVSESELPRRGRRDGRRQQARTAWPGRRESSHDASRNNRR
jgi:hypothetical protein